jgi:hypothetical protein
MASVFHYTDTAGLLGILSSDTLFATDYRYLNDVSEAGPIRDLIMPILEAEVAAITPKLIENRWLKKEYYDEHGVSAHRLQAEKLYASVVRAADNVTPFFVVSFCKHEVGTPAFEHGLLSQWRGYAEAGGFAIEFDEQKLDTLLKAETLEFAYAGTKSADVRYDKFEEVFDPAPYKGLAGAMIWEVFDHAGIDVTAVTGRKNLDEVMLAYIQSAPFFKHPGFSEEREYRIVAVCMRPSKVAEGETRTPKWIKFRQRNGLIVPYIELFERSNERFPIKSIIVGPHSAQDKQAEALAMALESEGIEASTRLSGIPYRR